jgi:hypothetical protein
MDGSFPPQEGTRRSRHPAFAGREWPRQVNGCQRRPSRVRDTINRPARSGTERVSAGSWRTRTWEKDGTATPLGRRRAASQRSAAVIHGAQRTVGTAARQPYPLEWVPPCRLWHTRGKLATITSRHTRLRGRTGRWRRCESPSMGRQRRRLLRRPAGPSRNRRPPDRPRPAPGRPTNTWPSGPQCPGRFHRPGSRHR